MTKYETFRPQILYSCIVFPHVDIEYAPYSIFYHRVYLYVEQMKNDGKKASYYFAVTQKQADLRITLRENIIMGSDFNANRYRQAVESVALVQVHFCDIIVAMKFMKYYFYHKRLLICVRPCKHDHDNKVYPYKHSATNTSTYSIHIGLLLVVMGLHWSSICSICHVHSDDNTSN